MNESNKMNRIKQIMLLGNIKYPNDDSTSGTYSNKNIKQLDKFPESYLINLRKQ
jgi:hypothetical protein